MSTHENLTTVQNLYASFGRGDIPAILSLLSDDVELHEPPGGAPPFTGSYSGIAGASAFFQAMADAVDVLAFQPREFFADQDAVVVLGHYCFRAKATDIAYDTDWAMVWRFRDGKICQFQIHDDSATEAAALRGPYGPTEQNKATARRWFNDIIAQGQLAVADEIFAANHIIHDPHGPPEGWPNGPQGLKMVASVFGGGFRDWQITIDDQIAEGDRVATRWIASAVNSGSVMGIPASGRSVRVTGVNVTRFVAGKIVESWFNFDMLTLLQQIGALPAAEQAAH